MRRFLSDEVRSVLRPLACCLVLALPAAARADDWPQWLGPKRDGVWREAGILDKFPKGGPKVRWRADVGMGYAGPAVAGGKVYVTDRLVPKGTRGPRGPIDRGSIPGSERVLCLDEKDGKLLWKHDYPCAYEVSYPAGPRATPLVAGDKVYTLGAMGDLCCLDTAKGKLLWKKNFPKEYNSPVPMWGFAASPLLDGNRLICLVGGEDSTVVAFDKDSGKELWKALSARELGYCPPMLIEAGGKRQLIIWHPGAVVSLNPETGKVYWSQKCRIRAGLTIPTPRHEGDLLFISSFYNGAMMLKLDKDKPGASVLWKSKNANAPPGSEQPRNTDALQAIMCTPVMKDGSIYGVCSYGELRCIKAATGERVWESLKATGGKRDRWANAFLVAQGDRFFLFNEHGDLILARLTPKGYEEIDRAHILDPTNTMARSAASPRRVVLWSHPAFADKAMFARNDKELVCVSLAKEK
jgi:outer membrane protein assembly factor BamB